MHAAARLVGAETELLFELSFDGYADLPFDQRELEVEARRQDALVLAEAHDQSDFLGFDDHHGLGDHDEAQNNRENETENLRVDIWRPHLLAEIDFDGSHSTPSFFLNLPVTRRL